MKKIGINRNLRIASIFILGICIIGAILVGFHSTSVTAEERPENAVGYYEKDGEKCWLFPEDGVVVDTSGLTPSQMEKAYPLSPELEASIVHPELDIPVIIDGIKYEGKEISRFDGKRLYFVIGSDGTFYAFTSAEGLEQYQDQLNDQVLTRYDGIDSLFFKDVRYGGFSIAMITGHGIPDLYPMGYDKALSSAKVTSQASWAHLYDQTHFQGNCLAIAGGVDVPSFVPYGWNDRAMSVRIE